MGSKDDDRHHACRQDHSETTTRRIQQILEHHRGEMDFVGPRPERPHFVSQLAEEIPYYQQRHLIAPRPDWLGTD